jgi:hypothetical protein
VTAVGVCEVPVQIQTVPVIVDHSQIVPWQPQIPEKSDMKFRPKGAVLKRAVTQLSSIVDSNLGVWGQLSEVARGHPRLEQLRRDAVVTMVGSKANNTLKTYLPYTVKWADFTAEFGFDQYPATPPTFLLFVQDLIGQAKIKENKSGVVTSAVYAVDFVHQLLAMPKPGAHDSIKLLLEGARKALARPVIKKNALSMEVVKRLIRHFVPDVTACALNGLRYAVYCALAFVLEARFSDIIDVCPDNIVDYKDRMVVFLEKTKTDVYREGAFVPFVNSGDSHGAYALVTLLLSKLPAGQDDISIFRRVNTGSFKGEFFRDETMSYTLVREGIKKALEAIGEDPKKYALHSFRSGAKSHVDKKQKGLPEGERIPERLSNKHGRWTGNSKSALGYTEEDDEDSLLVPNVLQL